MEESSGRSQEGQCWNWNYMMRFSILISMPILYLFVATWTSIFATNASVTGSPLHSISIESQRWLLPSASQSPFWSIGQFIHQSIYNVLRHPIHSSIPVFKVMGSLIPKFIHEVQTHHFPTFSPANVCLLFKKNCNFLHGVQCSPIHRSRMLMMMMIMMAMILTCKRGIVPGGLRPRRLSCRSAQSRGCGAAGIRILSSIFLEKK